MSEQTRPLQEFEGTYRGFNLSFDESHVAWGEAEVIIDAQQAILRGATGVGINVESRDIDGVKEVSAAEAMPELLEEGEAEDFRLFTIRSLLLVFNLKGEKDDQPVLLVPAPAAVTGPLFSPAQIDKGLYEAACKNLEDEFDTPGGLPLLELGGYAPVDIDNKD